MLEDFLKPLNTSELIPEKLSDNQLGKCIRLYEKSFPDLEGVELAIIGVKEERGALHNKGCGTAADEVRKSLYELYKNEKLPVLVDLGNIEAGATLQDTYVALTKITHELIKMKVTPVIIGGSHDLTYAQYLAYEGINKNTTLAVIDERIDLSDMDTPIHAQSYLMKILTYQPNFLFNISQIGYQSYFVEPRAIDTMEKMHFDCIRLGKVREDLSALEPILRDADLLSFDILAIRQSDAPANQIASPHGFYGEEGCQIARYAGLSDKLSSIGFYEFNPSYDNNKQSAQLVAQMIWYFIDGFSNRKKDYPNAHDKDFVKYIVNFKDNDYELTFWKSNKSNRWWIQVPARNNKRNEKFLMISCSYQDYQMACQEEVPERWLKAYQRLSQ